MSNAISMSTNFERQKNMQATLITAAVTGAVFFLILLIKLVIPVKVPPPAPEYVEINLGSGDVGSGKDQPLLPGDPAPAQATAYTPPQATPAHEEAVKDASTDEPDRSAAEVIKPTVTRTDATKINSEVKTVKSTTTTPTPAPPTPAPPRPRAVMGRTYGGSGTGGNGADSYKPGTGEGVAGGQGDQGRPGGNPNGTAYTGAPRSFGVREFSIPAQSFQDDFNQNAKIAMEIETNSDGKVVSAKYTSKGSTGTATSGMIDIARRRAFELKVGPSAKGTVIFVFKVQ